VGGGPNVELLLLAGILAIVTSPHLVAQAATEAGPWLTLVNLGVGGIFLWAFTTGKVHSDKELQRALDNNHALTEELRARNQEARESLIPALTRATDLLARHIERRDRDSTPPPPSKGRP
jgi:hypothetical protein